MTLQIPSLNGVLDLAGLTHEGQVREINEDTWAAVSLPTGAVFLVADGMGGHKSGEVASALARDSLLEALEELNVKASPPDSLARAFQRANLAVYQQAMRRSESRGMGTTMTAVFLDGRFAILGHVGDSRAYLVRDGSIQQLTRDHSWVADKVRQGILTEQEAREHKWRNVITNALGSYPQLRLDLFSSSVQQGDTIMLCSDGLTNVLTNQAILTTIQDNAAEPSSTVAQILIDAANAGGGPDNITVVIARVLQVNQLTTPSYRLPTLSERPGAVVPDPEHDVTTTMIIEPIRPSYPIWLWVLMSVFLVTVIVVGSYFLSKN